MSIGFKNKKKYIEMKERLRFKKCRVCGSTENLTIDHKLPIALGGTDDIKNLWVLCKKCNGIKGGDVSIKRIRQIVRWWLKAKGFKFNTNRLIPTE